MGRMIRKGFEPRAGTPAAFVSQRRACNGLLLLKAPAGGSKWRVPPPAPAAGRIPRRWGSVHQPIPQRVTNDLGVVGEFQLPQDVLAVGADRFDAEGKLARDVLDPLSPRHQQHHFKLTV